MKVLRLEKKTPANKIRECLLVAIDREISRKARGHHRLKSIEFSTKYLSFEITMNQTIISSATHFDAKENASLRIPSSPESTTHQRPKKNKSSNDKITEFIENIDNKKQLISKNKKISLSVFFKNPPSLEDTVKKTKREIMCKAMKELKKISNSLKRLTLKPSFNLQSELFSLCSCDNETKPSSQEGDEDSINRDRDARAQNKEGGKLQPFPMKRKFTPKNVASFGLNNDLKELQLSIKSLNPLSRNIGGNKGIQKGLTIKNERFSAKNNNQKKPKTKRSYHK